MNKECPIIKPRSQNPPSSKLTQILERDENGKPKLNLTSLRRTVVQVPTQKEYWDVMRVYECGGWKWSRGDLPTEEGNRWYQYKKETCVGAGIEFLYKKEKRFGYDCNEFYIGENQKVLSISEFYDKQTITPGMLKEINRWFDENGK